VEEFWSIPAIFFLEYAINHLFFDLSHWKIYFIIGYILELVQNNPKFRKSVFVSYQPQNMNCSRSLGGQSMEKLTMKKGVLELFIYNLKFSTTL
jgi:hypothetical protein